MLSFRTTLAIYFASLVLVATSQIVVKWRFDVIGRRFDRDPPLIDLVVAGLSDPWLWSAISLVGTGVLAWYAAMTRLPLSFMYPVAGSVAPIVAIGAHVFLGEPLSGLQMVAIVIIAAGVAMLGYLL